MSSPKAEVYQFGEFRLDTGRRLLTERQTPVGLSGKAFDTLLYLVEHRGIVLKKEQLMQAIWPDTVVEENNLNQNISTLRRVLGERRGENRYIGTIPGKGYHFIPAVEITGGTQLQPDRVTLAVLPFDNLG